MGFLKRFFSLSSRRNKKKRIPLEFDVEYVLPYSNAQVGRQNEHEATTSRLLRSSSAHFSVVSEVDYANLPPLPHPINNMSNTPPATPSIRSVQPAGTYTVTVHGRQVHTRAEFPNANIPLHDDTSTTPKPKSGTTGRRRINPKDVPVTPRDHSRILRLREDPSVASLLNMYDDQGRISSTAFSNTPPELNEFGRDQMRRTGSTLRQLLGSPSSQTKNNGDAEGDISWAERFLHEATQSTASLNSEFSLGLETPPDFLFSNDASQKIANGITLFTDHDLSMTMNTSDNCPTISSLEVELSGTIENTSISDSLYKELELKTPRPASQAFSFLTEKNNIDEKRLPALNLPSPSSDDSAESSYLSEGPAIPFPDDTQPRIFPQNNQQRTETIPFPVSFDTPSLKAADMTTFSDEHNMSFLLAGRPAASKPKASRIPRGPRFAPTRHKSLPEPDAGDAASSSTTASSSTADMFTPAPTRLSERASSRKYRTRLNDTADDGSEYKSASMSSIGRGATLAPRPSYQIPFEDEKENSPPATPPKDFRSKKSDPHPYNIKYHDEPLPITPLRHNSLLRVAHGVSEPPSPASSSDLSPIARELMMSVREQRMRAREVRRKEGRTRSTSRLKG